MAARGSVRAPCPRGRGLVSSVLALGLALGFGAAVSGSAAAQGKFHIEDLHFPVQDLRFPVQDLRFPVDALRLPVVDMTAPVAKTKKETKFSLLGDVLFDFDKATIRPQADAVLRRIAARIKKDFRRGRVRVEGHTDSMGSDAYNRKLSKHRAASVKTWFAGKGGISARRIAAQGFGEKRPVAPNTKGGKDNPEGRQQNRRVEIIVRR